MLEKALADIKRGSTEVIDYERVSFLVKRFFETGERYTVKAGFDPTAADLHLGHTVLLTKLATFQKYGATIQFLIGDFTAMIGDPTGKSETRKQLDANDVKKFALSYQEQVFKVLDKENTQIVYNADWLAKLTNMEMISLTAKWTVARMLERDDFEKRFKNNISISVHEFLYPLFQGYDSVALKSDIEIGGTDQKFNLLMGRHLQRAYSVGKEQAVLMMPILEGLDGVNKMSKSLGNYIGVSESANDIYAKLLSISDELMWRYYELLSSKSLAEIEEIEISVKSGNAHPKKVKEALALEITARYHGIDSANSAKAEFDKIHSANEIPTEIEEFYFDSNIGALEAMVKSNLASSNSDAKRSLQAGAFKLNSQKIGDSALIVTSGEYIAQVGKRKFAKWIVK
ncbi:MAG: hypothetical protein RL154_1619 [Pseudomonadota bacterium]|jgi:tyrosyl-tRNA synthetase